MGGAEGWGEKRIKAVLVCVMTDPPAIGERQSGEYYDSQRRGSCPRSLVIGRLKY